MKDETPAGALKRHLGSLDDEIDRSIERTRAYYLDDGDPPTNKPDLEKPPHQHLIEDAAKVLEFSVVYLAGNRDGGDEIISRLEYMLYGTSSELLLTGIHLKLDEEDFLSSLEEDGVTPNFDRSKQILVDDLGGSMEGDKIGVVVMMLKVLRRQRNNLLHFGFHHHVHSYHDPVILDVLGWLIARYSEEPIDSLKVFEERREAYRQHQGGDGIPDIGFDF